MPERNKHNAPKGATTVDAVFILLNWGVLLSWCSFQSCGHFISDHAGVGGSVLLTMSVVTSSVNDLVGVLLTDSLKLSTSRHHGHSSGPNMPRHMRQAH